MIAIKYLSTKITIATGVPNNSQKYINERVGNLSLKSKRKNR